MKRAVKLLHNPDRCLVLRLAHLTDPHLTSLHHVRLRDLRRKEWLGYQSWAKRRRRLHLRERLDQISAAMLSHEPDLICITGDLVHIGLADEHAEAMDWLQTLGGPERVVVVPGNHDIYTARAWPEVASRWRDWLRLDQVPTHPHDLYPIRFEMEGVKITLANTALPMPWYSAEGELGARQRTELADLLLTGSNMAPNVLLLHHPPEIAQEAGVRKRKALRDADKAANTLRQVDVILHGHTHHNDQRHYGRARVFSTASASAADASFRIFDLNRSPLGVWGISTSLYRLRSGTISTEGQESWLLER